MKKQVLHLLDCIKKGQEVDYNIYTGVEEFKDLVMLGQDSKERLQILIMCYVNNPTLKELNDWTLDTLIEYMQETNEHFQEDMLEITKCIELIKGVI